MKVFDKILSWLILIISVWNFGIYIGSIVCFESDYPFWVHILMIPNTITMLIYSEIITVKTDNGD